MPSLRIYEARLAAEIDGRPSPQQVAPVEKSLLLDVGELGIPIGEFQGIALGPELPDGDRGPLIVSDNNFVADVASDVLAFAIRVEPRSG